MNEKRGNEKQSVILQNVNFLLQNAFFLLLKMNIEELSFSVCPLDVTRH